MSSELRHAVQASLDEGYALLRAGAFEDAIEQFTTCLMLAPEEASAYGGRALAKFQLKEWAQATSDFARAKELNPEDCESWVGLGMSLAMEEKIYEGIDVLEALLATHPTYVRGHLQLGLLYYRLCIPAKGRRHLETALRCRPTLAERRLIEQAFREQALLDKRRYYRPDFEALRQHDRASFLSSATKRLRALLSTCCSRFGKAHTRMMS